ncbi:MAG: HDOD domain-containing protein, partial [Cellulomonadaceae bacterium]|nr:HDOD domain-containing protein [Cellulomonadaceae bacterium]
MDPTSLQPSPTGNVTQVHVGRQPIFDAALKVHAHELLFRAQAASTGSGLDPGDAATTSVIVNTFTAFGLRSLVGDALAFVNLTRPFLVGELPIPLSPADAVLEVLETIPVDDEVYDGVRRLKAAGFAVALDDFLWEQTDRFVLLPVVDYVKIDISQVPPDELGDTVARLRAYDVRLVAERIEDASDWARCRDLGFDLFQGYHLLKPETVSTTALNPVRAASLELLRRLSDPSLTMSELEHLVQRDAALTFRLLQATNSAASGARRRLESVRDALVMLGTDRLRSWVMLLVASDAGGGGGAQLTAAVTRARACETLARTHGLRPEVAFTAGLISRLDIVLGVDLDDLLQTLRLSHDLHEAIVEGAGPLGELLEQVRAYEGAAGASPRRDGHRLPAPAVGLDAPGDVAEVYVQAMA